VEFNAGDDAKMAVAKAILRSGARVFGRPIHVDVAKDELSDGQKNAHAARKEEKAWHEDW
jgi:hypothetical protein